MTTNPENPPELDISGPGGDRAVPSALHLSTVLHRRVAHGGDQSAADVARMAVSAARPLHTDERVRFAAEVLYVALTGRRPLEAEVDALVVDLELDVLDHALDVLEQARVATADLKGDRL